MTRRGLILLTATLAANAAQARTVTLADQAVFPESMTSTRRGDVIIGSVSQPYIYRAGAGQATASRWIDLSPFGSASYGVLADDPTNTLWVCTMAQYNQGRRPNPPAQRITALRAFDLSTGAHKASWPLPGNHNTCNDIVVTGRGAIFVSDTVNGRILKLGRQGLAVWYDGRAATRVDGLAVIGNTLYFNSLETGRIFQLDHRLATPDRSLAEIALDKPLKGPDGMRVLGKGLVVADNALGVVAAIQLHGATGMVRILREGLSTPTGVAPTKTGSWYCELHAEAWTPREGSTSPKPFVVEFLPVQP